MLSGDLLGNDVGITNMTRTLITSSRARAAQPDGFTITGGNANGGSPNDAGGGMFNASSSPTLTNVTFSGNTAAQRRRDVQQLQQSDVDQRHLQRQLGTNSGGGMYNNASSGPTLTNVTFSGNSATTGGGMYNANGSSPTLTNVTFSGNSANNGGGMYNYNSNPTLTNFTFSGNSATTAAGCTTIPVATRRCVIASCGAIAGARLITVLAHPRSATASCKAGTVAARISSRPIRCSACPAISDGGSTPTIPLLPGSSAIKKGTSSDCPATDQRGVPRGTPCDIGAYESRGFTLAKSGGDHQAALINTAFAQPLVVSVSSASEPLNGGQVILSAPASGASLTTTPLTLTIAGGAVSQSVTVRLTARWDRTRSRPVPAARRVPRLR